MGVSGARRHAALLRKLRSICKDLSFKGMYMCGSGTHPGGGVMAAPGANAAREILYDLKQTNTVPEGYADD